VTDRNERAGSPGARTRLVVEGIRLEGRHGVFAAEKRDGNRFEIDVEVVADLTTAVATDQLEDTIDYGSIVRRVEEINRLRRFNLIESFAGAISDDLLAQFPQIEETVVRVKKLSPPGLESAACATAVVRRSRAQRQ